MNCFYAQRTAASPHNTCSHAVQPLGWKVGMKNVKMAAHTNFMCEQHVQPYSEKMKPCTAAKRGLKTQNAPGKTYSLPNDIPETPNDRLAASMACPDC